jgi:hypothetical protein
LSNGFPKEIVAPAWGCPLATVKQVQFVVDKDSWVFSRIRNVPSL